MQRKKIQIEVAHIFSHILNSQCLSINLLNVINKKTKIHTEKKDQTRLLCFQQPYEKDVTVGINKIPM